MVTVVYKVCVKAGREAEFSAMAQQCEQCAHASKECLYYTFFEALNDPRQFLVSYRFASKAAQDRHIEKLRTLLGPSRTGEVLPAAFLDLVESEDVILFDVTD